MKIILIAAMAQNRVIGKENRIPWHIPEEMHYFKTTTTGHAIIMGRKTFESIGKALPNRFNVVLTKQNNLHFPGCTTASSLEQAIHCCRNHEKIFIIGGESIYKESMQVANTIMLSVLNRAYEGNVLFPAIPQSFFELVSEQQIGEEPLFTVLLYQRRQGV